MSGNVVAHNSGNHVNVGNFKDGAYI